MVFQNLEQTSKLDKCTYWINIPSKYSNKVDQKIYLQGLVFNVSVFQDCSYIKQFSNR